MRKDEQVDYEVNHKVGKTSLILSSFNRIRFNYAEQFEWPEAINALINIDIGN